MAVKSDLHPDMYQLEGTTLDVLGPNISNPHKNIPQARWESVSQTKRNVPVLKASPGNEYVAPLTHNQKNLLPAKKDAMPMYRRPRSTSDPTDSPDAAPHDDISSAALSGRQSKKLGDMWKTLLLDAPPEIKNDDLTQKDFQPIAVKRHDSFNELPSGEPTGRSFSMAKRSNSDNDIVLIEEQSPIAASQNWRDASEAIQMSLFAPRSSDMANGTSPTHTIDWEYEPATTASTSTSRPQNDTKQRSSSSSRRRGSSHYKRSGSRGSDGIKGAPTSGLVPSPPPPPPPPLPL
jgi:hypothetical protein